MATAAQRIAAWSASLDPRRRAGGGCPRGEAARSRHARVRARRTCDRRRRRGPGDDGRAGRRAARDGDRARARACRRPNAAFANAMLCHGLDFDDTHSDSVSHVTTVIGPAALAAGEQLGSHGRDVLAAIVGGQRGRLPHRHGGLGRVPPRVASIPTAICGVFGGTAAVARLDGLDAETTTRALGIAGLVRRRASSRTSRTARRRSRCIPPGRRTARTSPRGSRRTEPPARSRCSRGSSASTTPSSARPRARSTSTASSPTSAAAGRRRASPTSRTPCATSCTARSAQPKSPPQAGCSSRTRSRTSLVTVPEAGVSLVLEPAELKRAPRSEYEGKFSLQYSVASLLVRGHVDVGDFTDEAITDPGVLSVASRVRYETPRLSDLPAGLPGRRRRPPHGRVDARERPPVPARRAGEPSRGRGRGAQVQDERGPRASTRRGDGARGGDPGARGARRPARGPVAALGCARSRPYDGALRRAARDRLRRSRLRRP